MGTFWIENFGCRATQADAAAIEHQLAALGFRPVQAGQAELVVVNTCTVTAAADAQAREAIRAIHARNPGARILATGCYAQRVPEELAALPGVAWVVGNSHQQEIGALLAAAPGAEDFVPLAALAAPGRSALPYRRAPKILTGDIFAAAELAASPVTGAGGDRTRPVLKIQDGCNHRCSYCVIPAVRGRSRSLSAAEVVDQVRQIAAAGAQEVVLSGINLGAWGRDLAPRASFRDLLVRILDETPIERLRLSSIEPMDVTRDLAELAAHSPRLAPHFHVPLQSGSDQVLAAMHRWYRAAHYAERVLLLAEALPHAAIGADVICGFPGEREADHRATLDLLERLPFSYLHVFSYSSRPGTAAAGLAGAVPAGVVRQRAREVRALALRKAELYRAGQQGSHHRLLTLGRSGETSSGRPWTAALTGNYLHVRLEGRWPRNSWVEARLEAPAPGETRAELWARSCGNSSTAPA